MMFVTISSVQLVWAVIAISKPAAAFPALAPSTIEVRRNPDLKQSPVSGLPGCSKSARGDTDNQDPTWANGTSRWQDGEGIYIGTECKNGHLDNKCWTDYFLTGTQVSYNDWYQAIGHMQCDGNDSGASCDQEVSQLTQNCKTTTWSVSTEISAQADAILAQIGFQVTATVGQSYESCNANTTTETCTWNDAECHSIWAAQRITTAYGYKRKSCREPTDDADANMPNSVERSDGYYTRGMMDFAIPLADGNSISCRGTCESGYNPGPLPGIADGGVFKPWSKQ